MPRQLRAMADQLLNPIRARFSQIKTTQARAEVVREHLSRLEALVYETYSWDENRAAYIDIYATTYTEEELQALTAFFRSPVGEKFLTPGREHLTRVADTQRSLAGKLKPAVDEIQQDLQQALIDLRSQEAASEAPQ